MINNKEPLVSVVTPVYNIETVLEETIKSVLEQTYSNWELILIDDKSSDASSEIIKKWEKQDDRIKGLFLKENKGAGIARNYGINASRGPIIAFLDSDDLWLPRKLEVQIDYLSQNPEVDFIYSWYRVINEKGNQLATFVTPDKVNFDLLKFNNYILTSTVVYRKNSFKDLSFASMRKRQDWVFFLDLLKGTEYAYAIPQVTVLYRKMPNTLSSNRFKLIKPNFLFFRSYLYNGNSFKALIHFLIFLPFYFHNKSFNKRGVK